MENAAGSRWNAGHVQAAMAGLLAALCFVSLAQLPSGLDAVFGGGGSGFTYASPGELTFWLAHAFFLLPASALLAYAASPWLEGPVARAARRLDSLNERERRAAAFVLFAAALVVARVGDLVVFRDLPFTDDEYGVRFGGQVLASGHLSVPMPRGLEYFARTYLFGHQGRVSSFDYPGPQLVSAIGEITGQREVLWALFAALPAPFVAATAQRRWGSQAGVIAAIVWLVSPMVLVLGMTTHAHVLSRAFLGLAFFLHVRAEKDSRLADWLATGAALGAAATMRPIECAVLYLPLGLEALVGAVRRKPGANARLLGLVLGALPFIVAIALFDRATTGSFLPGRFVANEIPATTFVVSRPYSASVLWSRFGLNIAWNTLLLGVFFLGPTGVVAVLLGTRVERFTQLLMSGVVTLLAVGFAHDDYGIHVVGPVHFCETAVPLTLVATAGIVRLAKALATRGIDRRVPAVVALGVLAIGMTSFTAWYARSLRKQSRIHEYVYERLDRPENANSVVFAPRFRDLLQQVPPMRATGVWIWEWRRPQPDLSDPVLIVTVPPEQEAEVRARFPGRRFLRLVSVARPPWMELIDAAVPVRMPERPRSTRED